MLSRFPRRADARLFLALAIASALLTVVAIVGAVGFVGRTFPGFIVWDNLVVVALGRPSWPGVAAAVPFRARVLSIDGAAVATRGELLARVAAAPPGTPHRYEFETAAGRVTREVRAAVFRASDWALTVGVYLLNGLVFLVTALAVFYLKPESGQSRAVLGFGTLWGLVLVLAVDVLTAGHLQRLYFLLQAMVPAAVLHLARQFPQVRPVRRGALAAGYALGLAAGALQVWAFWRDVPLLVAVDDAVYLAIAGTGLFAMGAIARGVVGAASPLARRRARVVLAGAIAAFGVPLPALLAFFLLGQPVSFSLLTLTGFLFPLSIGYAVARHDLFEADRFVKLSLVYATLTALITLAYGLAAVVANRLVADLAPAESPFFPIVFVLAALGTIVPLRDRVQQAVDRLFYRGHADYKETIARASERMTTLLARDAIVQHLVTTLGDVLFLEGVTLWEREDGRFVRRGGSGPAMLAADDPGAAAFVALGRLLSRDEVEESAALRPVREPLRRLCEALEASLLVPLARQGQVAGLLAIGRKASGGPLSADDVDVLRTLADQTALVLANASAVEQLEEARASLARAERLAAIGELSAAVAHGIRNPLAGIRLAAQIGLECAGANEPVADSLQDVLTEVEKLEAQVRGILDFARPFEPRLGPVALPALVREVLITLTPQLDAAGVTAQLAMPADLPSVHADAAHLGQAFQELVMNGVEASGAGGTVRLTAAVDDGGRWVRVEVVDSGPGVPAALRERIFQLFMTTKATGTGVGLAVARKIIDRHGGRVSIDPAPGPGARFVVELPVAGAAPSG